MTEDPNFSETFIEPVEEEGAERELWEFHNVTLTREPGFGFGIGVSGGRDNPHFSNGDPSITVSDVLKDGPAEGKLKLNDRIVSVNNTSLENAEYGAAVLALRECGPTVNLVIKRRVVLPPVPRSTQSLQVTLSKNKKKEGFGLTLGCRFFIKDFSPSSQVEKDGSLQPGDVILKINHVNADGLTLKEVRKLLESGKDKLHLVVQREVGGCADAPSPPPSSADKAGCLNSLDAKKNENQNQNLYVQSPTRGDSELAKYNLPSSRTHREMSPDHPYELESDYREDLQKTCNIPTLETRMVSFYKDGNVGIRLAGGNKVGIFVSAIQPGSPASFQGLVQGDKLLKVNNQDLADMTREEAVRLLVECQDQVNLLVQYRKEEYDEIMANQHGDSFYIKVHFDYNSTHLGEVGFQRGQVFHVVDTLHSGIVGSWLVYKMGANGQQVQKGVIPNLARAEVLYREQKGSTKKEHDSRSRFFKRRSARRSKSLTRDFWEDMALESGANKFPAYEKVVFRHPGFVRPVVIFGPLADIARERLLREQSLKFSSPQVSGMFDDEYSPGIVRLATIQECANKGIHSVVDVAPGAVDRMNLAQLYPIVVFLKAGTKQQVKELRAAAALPGKKAPSSRKLYDHSLKLERLWSHIFTAVLNLSSTEDFFPQLLETLLGQQQCPIWMADDKPKEALSDDILFPMASRLSYASGPESDAEGVTEAPSLAKASSDTSLANREAPKFPTPPDKAQPSPSKNFETYPTLPLRSAKKSPSYATALHHMDASYGKPSHYGPPVHQRSQSQPATTSTPDKSKSRPPIPEPSSCRNLYVALPQATTDRPKSSPYINSLLPQTSNSSPYINSPPHQTTNSSSYINSLPPQTSNSSPYVNSSSHQTINSSPYINSLPPQTSNSSPYINSSPHQTTNSSPYINSLPPQTSNSSPYMNALPPKTSSTSPYMNAPPPYANATPPHSGIYTNGPPPKSSAYSPLRPMTSPYVNAPPHSAAQQSLYMNTGSPYMNALPPAHNSSPHHSYGHQSAATSSSSQPSYGSPSVSSSPYINAFLPPQKPEGGENPYGRFVGPPSRSAFSNGGPPPSGGAFSPAKPQPTSQQPNYTSPQQRTEWKPPPPPLPTKPTVPSSRLADGRPVPPPKPTHRNSQGPPPAPAHESYYQNQEVYRPNGTRKALDSKPGSAFELYKKPNGASPKVLDCVNGVFDISGGVLCSEQTGVVMVIPPGALDRPQELYIKVCQEDRLMPPLNTDKGETLLSPLVMCGPHGLTFAKPVQLRLPHKGTAFNPHNWSIALKSSHSSTGEPEEWHNLCMNGQHTNLEDGYITIYVKNF